MTLTPIGDIGSAALTQEGALETLTWETATDWNNRVSATGLTNNTYGDRADDSILQLGYNWSSFADVNHAYHADDAGPGMADFFGGTSASEFGSPTYGNGGVFGFESVGVDATSAEGFNLGYNTFISQFSGFAWVYANNWNREGSGDNPHETSNPVLHDAGDTNDTIGMGFHEDGAVEVYHDPSFENFVGSNTYPTGTWHLFAWSYDDGNRFKIWVNGNLEMDEPISSRPSGSNNWEFMGRQTTGDTLVFQGFGDELGIFENVAVGQSTVDDWYAPGDPNTGGSLTTGTKSFPASAKPDLQNLSYTLNSQSITLEVIGSPGTASEEVVSQTLDGSASYSLSWVDSHTDFRIRPIHSTTDPTVSPTFNRGELVATV